MNPPEPPQPSLRLRIDAEALAANWRALDALSLDVLTAEGLPVGPAKVLREFLDSTQWRAAVPAAERLRARGLSFRSEP